MASSKAMVGPMNSQASTLSGIPAAPRRRRTRPAGGVTRVSEV